MNCRKNKTSKTQKIRLIVFLVLLCGFASATVYSPTNYFLDASPSRGMALLFTGIVLLLAVKFMEKISGMLAFAAASLAIARGLMRVSGEQDIGRVFTSAPIGLELGVKLAIGFILLSLAITAAKRLYMEKTGFLGAPAKKNGKKKTAARRSGKAKSAKHRKNRKNPKRKAEKTRK